MSQTLDRALSILDFVAEKPRRVNEVAAELEVHPSTALRLLHTLRRHGFVHEMDDHHYRLGPGTFRLAFQALAGIDLRTVARPQMEELNRITGETVHLGVLGGDEVVYVEKVIATHPVTMQSQIGAIAPIHCTGVSKAILANLPVDKRNRLLAGRKLKAFTPFTMTTRERLEADLAATRERGFARDNQEHSLGIHCVAAPILAGDNDVLGSFSVSAPTSRVDEQTLLSFVPALKKAVRKTSEQFGFNTR
jgi:DNA-binding IclR family transcriptional regulator